MILGIYCAGSLGKELYDMATRINAIDSRWEKIIFVDDVFQGASFYGAEVHRIEEFSINRNGIEFVIANGTPVNRQSIYHKIIEGGYHLTSLIDPTAIVSSTAKLGEGIIVTPYSTISSDVVLKDNVLIQSYVRVGHDIVIAENTVISANVGIGGNTNVGENTYVGLGAVIKEDLSIGNNTIVGMGTVIHTDVDDGVIIVGNPGRVVKRNIDNKVFR